MNDTRRWPHQGDQMTDLQAVADAMMLVALRMAALRARAVVSRG